MDKIKLTPADYIKRNIMKINQLAYAQFEDSSGWEQEFASEIMSYCANVLLGLDDIQCSNDEREYFVYPDANNPND